MARRRPVVMPLFAAFTLATATPSEASQGGPCLPPGGWFQPGKDQTLDHANLIADLATRSVVLLGEEHDNPDHHRWQLVTVAALQARARAVVLGFEMFPRRVQPALDRWVAGRTNRKEFLTEVRWDEVWGYDPDLYMPLFDFARLFAVPMVALNVDHALIKRVTDNGWSSVPVGEREGLSDPVPAPDAYLKRLAQVYASHGREPRSPRDETPRPGASGGPPTAPDMNDLRFRHFVEAQLTWDGAMAQALAEAGKAHDGAVVVGIMGKGHLEYGDGAPRQLRDLGIDDAAILLPWDSDRPCGELVLADGSAIADAVFALGPASEIQAPDGPRLGIRIEDSGNGVRIREVLGNSVAEASGLKADDVITSAAGRPMVKTGDLIAVVRRMEPGTWLPITLRRSATVIEVVAKFPPRP